MNQQKPHWTGWRHHIIMRCLVALLLFGCGVITGMAQEVKLTGSVIGANDGAPLIGRTRYSGPRLCTTISSRYRAVMTTGAMP